MTLLATTILVIDDEPHIRKFLEIALRTQHYHVILAETGLNGLEILINQSIDLVILDLGLPDLDGLSVLTELRQWNNVPVIVLSARPDEQQKVLLLDAGANDYVTKPFSIQELFARIRVLLREKSQRPNVVAPIFDDGYLFIDPVEHIVKIQGQECNLGKKEFQLLALLFAHKGKVVAQKQIMTELWGVTHTDDTHYLRILVKKLRDKIGDSAITPHYIQTVAGIGLRFMTA